MERRWSRQKDGPRFNFLIGSNEPIEASISRRKTKPTNYLSQISFLNNLAVNDTQQDTLNSDAVTYSVTSCRNSSSLDSIGGSEWPNHPPLKGDGTSTFTTQ